MKPVSNAYKQSMKSILRNRSHVRIVFSNVDTEAAKNGEWVSNGAMGYSELDTVDFPYQYGETYATLELNRWALDGKTTLLPTSGLMRDGFVSSLISDAQGNFSTAAVLVREFSTPMTFPGLTLTFDTRTQEWPLSLTARFYLNGQVVASGTVQITDTMAVVEERAVSCDKIELVFEAMLPYRRPRLEEVLYGVKVQFTSDGVLASTKQSHDVDPLSRRLPKESFQFTILDYEHNYDPDNPSGIYVFVDKNAPVSIQFGYELPSGVVEWLKPDKYVLNAKPTTQNNQASFTGTGLIESLTGTFYKGRLGRKSFYDMAEEVLLDANLTLTEQEEHPWVIGESLKSMFTTAALPIDTHMNCLQLIAHACRCRLFTDDDNIIHIKPFGVTVIGIYSGVWADNGHLWYSEWNTVDRGNTAPQSYVTLELNRWVMDGGNQVVISDDPVDTGYIGNHLSGSDGTFSTAPVFSKTFDVSHDLPVVAIRFDTPLEEYPSAIRVRYYSGDILLDTQIVENIDSPEVMVSSNAAFDCTKVEVTALSALPGYRLRVGKVYYRETDFTLDFTTIGENTQSISKIDQLKAVSVARYSYSPDSDTQTLFEGTTAETHFHVEFSGLAQDIQISVSGGTLISSEVYARAADLVLSSGTKTVVITGKTLTESSVVVSYPVALEGEIDKEENPLITSDEMSQALAAHVMRYLQMRNTYDTEYRGNPEMEAGDIIGLQTAYTPEMDALVLVDEITFNGSLKGKMKVKGLI